jgi:Holliday junction resolvase RusA-like endonuclease
MTITEPVTNFTNLQDWNSLNDEVKAALAQLYLKNPSIIYNYRTGLKDISPSFIDGPATLQAMLTFLPIPVELSKKEKTRSKKDTKLNSKNGATVNENVNVLTGIVEPEIKYLLGIPLLNEYIDAERSGWRGREMVRTYRKVGYRVGAEYLESQGIKKLELKWVKISIVAYWPDFNVRDVHNLYVKAILDGLTVQGGYWSDDCLIIQISMQHGGVDMINPRCEMFIWELELSKELEARILTDNELFKLRTGKKKSRIRLDFLKD